MLRASVRIVLAFIVMSTRIIAAEPATPSNSQEDTLETILKKWEQARVQRQSVSMKFQLMTCDRTFLVEQRGTGSFDAHIDQTGDYRVESSEIPAGSQSSRTDGRGRRYTLLPIRSEHWQWRTTFLRITHNGGYIEEINFPEEMKPSWMNVLGLQSVEWWPRYPVLSPYVFGIPADELKERFKVSLIKQTDKQIHVRLLPRRERDQASFAEVNLLLDSNNYVTKAIKTIDSTRNREQLYVFEDVEITRSSDNEFRFHPLCAELGSVY